jgi:hypothetical protein
MTPTSPTSGDVVITSSLSATGTPDNTKFLRGDNFWSTVNLQSVLTAGKIISGLPLIYNLYLQLVIRMLALMDMVRLP